MLMPMLATCLMAQGFDGINGGGAACRIQSGQDGDGSENGNGHRSRLPCRQQAGEEVGHRQQVDQCTQAEREEQTATAADQRNNECFQEELPQEAVRRSSNGFAYSDLAGALANRYQHDVHDTEATEKQGYDADRAEKVLHAIRHGAEGFCFLDGVPDGASFFIARIEIVQSSQQAPDLSLARFVVLDPARDDQP